MEIRKLLSITKSTPIDEVINTGVVPRLIQFLDGRDIKDDTDSTSTRDHVQRLQHEAVWALSNIASGTNEHVSHLMNHGAAPKLVKLIWCIK